MSVVLMYHSVTHQVENPYLQIRPEELARQLDWLPELGYRAVSLAEALANPGERLAAVTFDDGLVDFLLAVDLFVERGIRPMLFVCPGLLGGHSDWTTSPRFRRRPILRPEQLRELPARGIDLGSHGWTHASFLDLEPEDLDDQLGRCRWWFEQHLGLAEVPIAYPYGHCDVLRGAVVARHHRHALAVDPIPELPIHLAVPRPCGTDGLDRQAFARLLEQGELETQGL